MKNKRYIDITLHKIEDAESKYNSESLNEELDKYILKESLGITKKEDLIIKIHTKNQLDKNQKEHILKMIRSNYGMDISDGIELVKHENVKRVSLLIIGLLAVVMSELFEYASMDIIADIFLIIGWGAIWEAVYSLMFVNVQRRRDITRLEKIVESKIEFIGGKNE